MASAYPLQWPTVCPHCGAPRPIPIGEIRLLPDAGIACGDRFVRLPRSEQTLLMALVGAGGEVVPADRLRRMAAITGGKGALAVHMHHLRAALRDAGARSWIVTRYGQGYAWRQAEPAAGDGDGDGAVWPRSLSIADRRARTGRSPRRHEVPAP